MAETCLNRCHSRAGIFMVDLNKIPKTAVIPAQAGIYAGNSVVAVNTGKPNPKDGFPPARE